MRSAAFAILVGVVGVALMQGIEPGVAGDGEDEGSAAYGVGRRYPPHGRGFDVQVVVDGRALPQRGGRGERRVEAVLGREYELRLTNPLGERVAVAVSVDGLNVLDARHTSAWDASKWVIHPHDKLTLSGWQVGSERARRFYFTTENDAYATRIGRPAEFGVISAVFYRERRPYQEIVPHPHRLGQPERVESYGAKTDASPEVAARSPAGLDRGSSERRGAAALWRSPGRAATGIGNSVRSEVDEVHMELEPHPAAVVTLRYDYRPTLPPRPIVVPGFAPEPHRGRWDAQREERRFAPEP
jgi:hypothetical protein